MPSGATSRTDAALIAATLVAVGSSGPGPGGRQRGTGEQPDDGAAGDGGDEQQPQVLERLEPDPASTAPGEQQEHHEGARGVGDAEGQRRDRGAAGPESAQGDRERHRGEERRTAARAAARNATAIPEVGHQATRVEPCGW